MSSKYLRCSIHGVSISLRNAVPSILPALQRALSPFVVDDFPSIVGVHSPTPLEGTIRPYLNNEVLRHLSPTATRVTGQTADLEIYQDGERFWLIDDSWGLVELNLLKGRWRAWVLPEATLDLDRIVEFAFHWPAAQLMRSRGVHLLPCASVARGESGMLVISPLSMSDELTALVRAGYRIVSQRWTAVREEEGRLAILSLPGRTERTSRAVMRSTHPLDETRNVPDVLDQCDLNSVSWIDLERQFTGCSSVRANLDRVMIVEPGRRPTGNVRRLSETSSLAALRCAWPIADLHPQRAYAQLPAKLARRCQVFNVRLSNRPADLLNLIDGLRRFEFEQAVQTLAVHETTRQLERQIARVTSPISLAG